MSVCAVIVTRNRRELLVECLAALRAQTRAPDHVLVVDNASTDGTAEMLRRDHSAVETVALGTNEGGAGGFHEGLRRAHDAGFDWIWLMDDDTIPTPTALEALLDAVPTVPDEAPTLFSSRVVWTDGRLHPMNQPGFERASTAKVIQASEQGVIPLRTATFVSLLVNRRAIDRHGLPLRRYFLWSDDIEYTARVLRHEAGYLVPASVVVHKTNQPYTAVSTTGDRFYFHVRNTLYMVRSPAWAIREKPGVLFGLFVSLIQYLQFTGFTRSAVTTVARGMRDGLKPGVPTPAHP